SQCLLPYRSILGNKTQCRWLPCSSPFAIRFARSYRSTTRPAASALVPNHHPSPVIASSPSSAPIGPLWSSITTKPSTRPSGLAFASLTAPLMSPTTIKASSSTSKPQNPSSQPAATSSPSFTKTIPTSLPSPTTVSSRLAQHIPSSN